VPTFSQRFANLPEDQVAKVNAFKDEGLFTHVGKCVVETLEREAGDLSEFRDILDFGCGLGRVLRPLVERVPGARIVGFDIDPSILDSCRRLLEDDRLRLVSSTGEFPGESFDLIFAISVFTHLDASFEFWLEEVHRLLRPAGKALLTYQDETLFTEMVSSGKIAGVDLEKQRLEERFVVGAGTLEGDAEMGTFVTTKHWEALLGSHFKILRTVPRGLFGHQSYSVLSKA
jgi:SAM-dependent methyltransferase